MIIAADSCDADPCHWNPLVCTRSPRTLNDEHFNDWAGQMIHSSKTTARTIHLDGTMTNYPASAVVFSPIRFPDALPEELQGPILNDIVFSYGIPHVDDEAKAAVIKNSAMRLNEGGNIGSTDSAFETGKHLDEIRRRVGRHCACDECYMVIEVILQRLAQLGLNNEYTQVSVDAGVLESLAHQRGVCGCIMLDFGVRGATAVISPAKTGTVGPLQSYGYRWFEVVLRSKPDVAWFAHWFFGRN